MGNVLDSCNQRSIQQYMKSGVVKPLGVAGIQQQNGLVDKTNVTHFSKVRCFLIQSGLSKVFWAKIQPGVEFEVEPQEDHIFEVEPRGNVDRVVGSHEVQTQDLIYYHSALDREKHLAWELFSYTEYSNESAFVVAVVDKIYAHESLTFNNTVAYGMVFSCGSKTEIWVTKGLLVKAKGNILGLEIIKDQSGNTLRVSQSRIHNEKLVHTLLKGHSTLSSDDSLSGDCDVKKNEGIATGALVKGYSWSEVPTHVKVATYR
nr:zinc finger, CCHC-type [Tanacetum cinerariifolium]